MKILVEAKEYRQLEEMRKVIVSLQLANRAIVPGHAKRLLHQAISEAEAVFL